MRSINPLELGLMFWAGQHPEDDILTLQGFGLSAGQLGIGGELATEGLADRWQAVLASHPEIALTTAVCSYAGEDYADIPTVQRTVGLVPLATRAERVARTEAVAGIAAQLGIGSVACHIGFVPEARTSSSYRDLCAVVRALCDRLLAHGQNFALETGQESAAALLHFLEDVDRPNLKINFDPANMLLYGTGDPVEAVRLLGPHIVSVHCKDGTPPDTKHPGALGVERPLGHGAVDFAAFFSALNAVGYRGILSIEREEPDPARRSADIHHAISFLRAALAQLTPVLPATS